MLVSVSKLCLTLTLMLPLLAAPQEPITGAHTAAQESPLRVGGNVKPPVLVHQAKPKYPKQAAKAGTEGAVKVYLWVGKDGLPSHIRVVKGLGMGFDEAAVDAIRQYKFSPATREGEPVPVEMYVEVNFHIRKP